MQALGKIADEAGITIAQMAVAFTLEHPYVTSAIIGPRTMDHLEGLLPAAEIKLNREILDKIDALVPPGSNINEFRDVPDGTDVRRRA